MSCSEFQVFKILWGGRCFCSSCYGMEGVSAHLGFAIYIYVIYIYDIYIYIHIQKAYVFADGHTESNAPDLFRPPKLRGSGPG